MDEEMALEAALFPWLDAEDPGAPEDLGDWQQDTWEAEEDEEEPEEER